MSERRVVSRNKAIALGIITIALLLGLVITIVYHTSTINDKDSTISARDSQIAGLQNQKNQLQTWLDGNGTKLTEMGAQITSKNDLITSLQSQLTYLTLIANLQEQSVIVNQYTVNQDHSSLSPVTSMQLQYAGYLHIISTSTTDNAYIKVEYWFQEDFSAYRRL